MLLISCPFCGPRPESEFQCGGEAHLVRPGPAEEVSAEIWANYLFMRSNLKGRHYERWVHTYGCGQWFNVVRDTVSHDIEQVYAMDEPKPDEVQK